MKHKLEISEGIIYLAINKLEGEYPDLQHELMRIYKAKDIGHKFIETLKWAIDWENGK